MSPEDLIQIIESENEENEKELTLDEMVNNAIKETVFLCTECGNPDCTGCNE